MTQRVVAVPIVLIAFFSVCAFSQSLPDIGTVKDLPATESPSPKYQRINPIAVNPADSNSLSTEPPLLPQFSLGRSVSPLAAQILFPPQTSTLRSSAAGRHGNLL